MSSAVAVSLGLGFAGAAAGWLRWLRVAQREHYIAGSATRFAARWWASRPLDVVLVVAALVALAACFASAWAAVVTCVVALVGPIGMGLRGRSSPVRWTRRFTTLAAIAAGIELVALAGAGLLGTAVGSGAGGALAGAAAIGSPIALDLACLLAAPLEARLLRPYLRRAAERLAAAAPSVVAITGSYGKTSTKGYIAHLLAGRFAVVASPASFNNLAGLARTVNEHLAPGTQVLVAEMGTYGKGEISRLCALMTPQVAVITAIGPVHLERFGSEDAILAAKAEITEKAEIVVLNVDDARLAALADRLEARGAQVWRCSGADPRADVWVGHHGNGAGAGPVVAVHRGEVIGGVGALVGEGRAAPTNVACAVAVALALGVESEEVARRLPGLPVAPNRLGSATHPGGFEVLDDTYNSNPAGARLALSALARLGSPEGRRVVVTPGMVELGPRQEAENRALAARAATVATDLVVVGRTNRTALVGGARSAGIQGVFCVKDRRAAQEWARAHLGPGDAVLYENDLPDHYP